ncbi:MAG TPA: FHA domain-containing protein [Solidesulfovibrio sp.]|nr:hypothetical protein [Desulfovibrio sp.]HML59819.1 FHA domain-containing protein [Solidesulfovibrio sp.]
MMEPSVTRGGQPSGPVQMDRTEFRSRPTFAGKGQNAVEILAGPGQGTIHRFEGHLLIGRAARCDLVIDDATVSREHLTIESRGGKWQAASRNPKNPALKNGIPFQSAYIATGDTLTVGPARLRLALSAPKPGIPLPPGLLRLFGNRKFLIGTGIGLFVLLAILSFLSQPAKTPQESVVESDWGKQRALKDAEFMHQVSTLLLQARRLHDEGHNEQALTRLDTLLGIDAANGEALRLKADIQAAIEAKAAEAKKRQVQAALAMEKVGPQIREAERLLAAGNTAGARALAEKAQAQAPDVAEVRAVLDTIEAKEAADQRQASQKAQAAAARHQELTGLYAAAAADLAADDLYKALLVYRRLGEEEAEPARTAVRRKTAEIQDALVKRVMPDFIAGQKFYTQKQYAAAYRQWVKVLEVYPEAKETKTKVAELTPMLEAEAKRLYEEGLVHEGLGNRETAMARWQAVLEAMPDKDNAYYRRAAAKLGIAPDGKGQP